MLFQATTTITLPPGFDSDKLGELASKERERAHALQASGKLIHLWRVAGKRSSVLIFKVDSPEEFHDLLASLPFYPLMTTVEVAALSYHPNALESD